MTSSAAALSTDSPHRHGSEVELDEWISPDICDARGELRAGVILEWLDVIGVLAAARHCRRPVVTVSVDGMELRDPILLGERVTMRAAVAFTSERSIGVSVWLQHGPPGQPPRRSVEAYVTFAALGEDGRPLTVPPFHPSTSEEQSRFREGSIRREFRQKLAAGELSSSTPPMTPKSNERLFVRELLKFLPRSLNMPWDITTPRARHDSYVHKIEPVRANSLNFHGTLYGGHVMRWIESTARLSASAYLDGADVRLVSLHGLTFIRPVEANVFVHIRALVAHTTATALTVLVNVDAEDPVENRSVQTLRALLTYSPAATRDRTSRVAPIECTGDDERALFDEVEHRLTMQRRLSKLAPSHEAV